MLERCIIDVERSTSGVITKAWIIYFIFYVSILVLLQIFISSIKLVFFFFVWIFSLLLYLSVSKNFQINLTRNYKWTNSTTNIKRQTKIMKQRVKMTYKVSNWKSIVVTKMKKNWKKANNTCLKKKNRRSFSCWYKISQNYRLFANIKCSKVLFHFSEFFFSFF